MLSAKVEKELRSPEATILLDDGRIQQTSPKLVCTGAEHGADCDRFKEQRLLRSLSDSSL